MIYESQPWKQEVARHIRTIDAWTKKVHTQKGCFLIERGIFLSAFIVRKLIENKKMTDRLKGRTFRCRSYKPFRPLSDRVMQAWGVADIDKQYDLSKPSIVQSSFYDLSSEIMHSYIFVPEVGDNGDFVSFFINSYREQDNRLLSISIDAYQKALKLAVVDDVVSARVYKDPKTGRIKTKLN